MCGVLRRIHITTGRNAFTLTTGKLLARSSFSLRSLSFPSFCPISFMCCTSLSLNSWNNSPDHMHQNTPSKYSSKDETKIYVQDGGGVVMAAKHDQFVPVTHKQQTTYLKTVGCPNNCIQIILTKHGTRYWSTEVWCSLEVLHKPQELTCENLASSPHEDLAMATLVEGKVTKRHSPTAT